MVRIKSQIKIWDYITWRVPKGMLTNLAVFNYYLLRILLFRTDCGLTCLKTADSEVYM